MHELSIAQSILAIAENAIPENCKASVTSVGLQIGELSSIEIESLEFAFSVIKADTLLQNAELNIQIIKGEGECSECKKKFPIGSYGTCCPECKSYAVKILKGREMRVLNIVVDE
jgi:hydrogenase nickel incorporation protein HypA/HybF